MVKFPTAFKNNNSKETLFDFAALTYGEVQEMRQPLFLQPPIAELKMFWYKSHM